MNKNIRVGALELRKSLHFPHKTSLWENYNSNSSDKFPLHPLSLSIPGESFNTFDESVVSFPKYISAYAVNSWEFLHGPKKYTIVLKLNISKYFYSY